MVIWSGIEGYSSYKVSDDGVVLGKTGKPLKPYKTKAGYLEVSLSEKGVVTKFNIHRLVAKAFISNTENLPQVNHLNGDPSDNRVCNLEWCTVSRNQIHSCDTLGNHRGEKQHCAKLKTRDVKQILKMLRNKIGTTIIARAFSVDPRTIDNIKAGRSWNWLSGFPRKIRCKSAKKGGYDVAVD